MAKLMQFGLSPHTAAAILVVASTSFNSITGDAMVAGMPIMATDLDPGGDGAFLVQMILVAPSIAIIIGSPLAGWLSHRLGVRRLMLLAVAIYLIAGAFGSIAATSVSLVVSRLILGLVSGLLGSLALSFASQFEDNRKTTLIGFANSAAATTAILSFLVGGWLAQEFGWRSASLLYLWPALLLPWISRAVSRSHPAQESTDRDEEFPWLAVLPLYLAAILLFLLVFASMIEGPFLLSSRGMTDASLIGVALAITSFTCVIVSPFYGWIDRRVSAPFQLLAILVIYFTTMVIASMAGTPMATIGAFMLGSVAGGLVSPFVLSRVLRRVPPFHAATAAGLFVSATYLSVFLAPSTYKLLKSVGVTVFDGLGICCAVAIAIWLLWYMTRSIGRQGSVPT